MSLLVVGCNHRSAPIEVRVSGLPHARIRCLRTGRSLGSGPTFKDTLKPWEANLYLLE